MTQARRVITDALTHRLNKLSPGETLDSDTALVCLDALNVIVDEFNGQKGFLFRDVLTGGAVTGASGVLGTNWPTLAPGDTIEGATIAYSAGTDTPLVPMAIGVYANIPDKSESGSPQFYAPDGYATIFFYPAATGQTITLRTRQVVSTFADLDADYGMPAGYRSALADLLAERIALPMLGRIPADVKTAASTARVRLGAQAAAPAIIHAARAF